MIRNVVFDMDGVLFDTERISAGTWATEGALVGIPELGPAIQDFYGLNPHDSRALFEKRYGDRMTYDEWDMRTRTRTRSVIEREGLPVKTGVREILAYLKAEGMGVALCTSSPRPLVLKYLKETGLTEFFQEIITGDMVTHGKPAPDVYLLSCEKLGAEPSESVAVEDSYNGLKSAHAAGMLAVMVPDMKPYVPELEGTVWKVCPTLLDLIEIIREQRSHQ